VINLKSLTLAALVALSLSGCGPLTGPDDSDAERRRTTNGSGRDNANSFAGLGIILVGTGVLGALYGANRRRMKKESQDGETSPG